MDQLITSQAAVWSYRHVTLKMWELFNTYTKELFSIQQWSFCLCAQPMRWRYNVTLSLIGWAHSQMIPEYAVSIFPKWKKISNLKHLCHNQYVQWIALPFRIIPLCEYQPILSIFFRIPSMAQWQSYDCPCVSEESWRIWVKLVDLS